MSSSTFHEEDTHFQECILAQGCTCSKSWKAYPKAMRCAVQLLLPCRRTASSCTLQRSLSGCHSSPPNRSFYENYEPLSRCFGRRICTHIHGSRCVFFRVAPTHHRRIPCASSFLWHVTSGANRKLPSFFSVWRFYQFFCRCFRAALRVLLHAKQSISAAIETGIPG